MKRLMRHAGLPALLLLASFSVQADWNVTIGAASSNGGWSGASPDVWTPSATGATVAASEIDSRLAGGTPVVIQTTGGGAEAGDITVNATASWSANKLTLTAANNIAINASLNGSGSASLALEYGQGAVAAGNISTYTLSGGAQVSLPAGANFSTKLGSNGATNTYTVITSLGTSASSNDGTLQGMVGALGSNYALGANIDASATSGWNAGVGFTPVGTSVSNFTGVFDGLGHTITGLTVNNAGTDFQGLFGYNTGTLRNVGLLNSSVSGRSAVGTLAGQNTGAIRYSYADGGSVTGNWGGSGIGGLSGGGSGSISNSYANVTLSNGVGGGINTGAGGLAGVAGAVSNSYATGSVIGSISVGGLVGQANGNISNSYATGTVTGTTNVGGLVGSVNAGTTSNSYWNKATTGQNASAAGTGVNTTALMQSQASFTGFDFTNAWRIYEGHSTPLLKNLLTQLTVTASAASKTYDGAAYSGGNGVAYSVTPNAKLLGTVSYGGSSQGAVNTGSYAITPSGLYSTSQQGYDIAYVDGTLTVTPYYPPAPSFTDAPSGVSTTLTGTIPVTAWPGSTLMVPAWASVSGVSITLTAPATGAPYVPVTLKIGNNVQTLTPVGANAVLTLKTVNLNGVPTLVPALSSGTVAISASAGQPVIMYINGGAITAGSNGGTVSQTMNGDGTATLSVTEGYVLLPANAFAAVAIKDNKLYAGEIANIGSDGTVTQVRLGSLSGSAALVGDALAPAPAADLNVKAMVPNLAGKVARVSGAQDFAAALAASLGTQFTAQGQNSGGVLLLGFPGGTVQALPYGKVTVDTSRPDGITLTVLDRAEVATGGVITSFAPAVSDFPRFAATLAKLDKNAAVSVLEDGMVHVRLNGVTYPLQPAWTATQEQGGQAGLSADERGMIVYRDGAGNRQVLYPVFADLPRLIAVFKALDANANANASVASNGDGTATAKFQGRTYTLKPDYSLSTAPAEQAGKDWWQGQDGKLYIRNTDGSAQGFSVQ